MRGISKFASGNLREIIEALFLFAIIFGAAHYFDAFDFFYAATRAHEDWELDELILAFMAMPLPLAWFAYRKTKDLSQETANRMKLEEAVSNSDKMKSLGVLAGGVAHEINNQLLPILSMAELVRDHMDVSDKDYRKMEIILKSAQNAQETVSKILHFSRDQGQTAGHCDITAGWQTLEPILQTLCPANITLDITVSLGAGFIRMSDNDFHSVIINLMSNSIDSINDKPGAITINAYTEMAPDTHSDTGVYGTLFVKFMDTGPGIAPHIKERIFDPFFTTKAAGQGVGLGLSIIYFSITEAGGSIQLDPEVEEGCQFIISMPLHKM